MAASFAAYASQFINRQPLQESSQGSHEPLFFSFTSEAVPEDDDDPHLDPFRRSPSPPSRPPLPPPLRISSPPSPPPIGLTESLLPRDRHVFSLPDPRYPVRRKFNDATWTAVWLSAVSACVLLSLLVLFVTHKPSDRPSKSLPYTTLLRTIPTITVLVVLSAIVSYAHVLFLRVFLKPVIVGTAVFVPATLFLSALCAFVGSFTVDDDHEPTWGETTGLRLFSLVPLVLSLITGRRLLHLPRALHTTSTLLTLTTRILYNQPFLLALSPAVLLLSLLASIPFATLAFRLLLIGYMTRDPSGFVWHLHAWANWAIAATLGLWLWTWGVARGILRVSCAGVIGAWYFANQDIPPPPPGSTHEIHAALFRATQPSLGSVVLASLILAVVRMIALACAALRALPPYLPPYMRLLSVAAGMLAAYLENVTNQLSTYALVYIGLSGERCMTSARRARALTGAVESEAYKQKFRTEPPLTMLTIAPLTLTFPFALTTYLFVAHTLDAPDEALEAALLAGVVTALVGLFCVGLVKDTADTLYMCYCIDKDTGMKHREEVFSAFEYNTPRPPATQAPRTVPAAPQPTRPSGLNPSRYSFQAPVPSTSSPYYPNSSHSTASTSKPPISDVREQQPRRTQRLEPPAREDTETPELDPFDLRPIHEHEEDVDPFEPDIHMHQSMAVSPSPSELELGMGMGMGLGASVGYRRDYSSDRDSLSDDEARRQEERDRAKAGELEESQQDIIGSINESQLFPMGSDLF
ncbi:plasma-membrane choline transporter-domain-containing protein [Cytidiella melzeri]|nr:plasma-membrane choline transporter-domain-containing protein [Cytidiella melzeri]